MASINASSTLAQVQASYDDNASFEEDADAAKCRAFLTAARILLRRIPEEMSSREGNTRFRIESIEKEIARASAWLQANGGGSGGGNGGPSTILIGTNYSRGR